MIVIDIDGDGVVEWLNVHTSSSADAELDWVQGRMSDVLDAVIHNTTATVEDE